MTDEVVIADGERRTGMRFHDPVRQDYGVTWYSVALSAPEFTARLDDIENLSTDNDLAEFLKKLADDFRGWEGTRRWESWGTNVLALSAEFRPLGHVRLAWEVRPRTEDWTACVAVEVDAGEQLRSISREIAGFLGS